MSELSEDNQEQLLVDEISEVIEYYDIQEAWERNPNRIKLEQELEELHQQIHQMIKEWPEID